MSSRFAFVLVAALAAGSAACRQADGPLPTPTGETPNRLGDISRDLASVSRGEEEAQRDLADDLRVFVDSTTPGAEAALDELSRRTSSVIVGKPLSEQNAQRLAHQLWTAVAARDISERQVEALQNEMHALLVSVGVPEENAQNAAAQIAEVQRQVTTRPRRWYEVF